MRPINAPREYERTIAATNSTPHAANAVFRALENGLPLVRCANNGLTCWVDAQGRMQDVYFPGTQDIYGAGIKSGLHKEKVTPQAIASILSRALDVPPPEGADAPVPEGLFKNP